MCEFIVVFMLKNIKKLVLSTNLVLHKNPLKPVRYRLSLSAFVPLGGATLGMS